MKKFFYYLTVATILTLTSCTVSTSGDLNFDVGISDDSGNGFQINLKLPIDDGACYHPDDGNDTTYCITEGDTVKLSVYSTSDISEQHLFDNTFVIPVSDNLAEDGNFTLSPKLIKNHFYRFYAEVTNQNGIPKLTGGVNGFHYTEETSVSIFMAPAGDFARVVSNRMKYEESSLKTYFNSSGSKGASAVALKDGTIFLSGGYSFDYEVIMPDAMILDMKTLTTWKAANLNSGLMDHASALLDDGSETGKVILAFGKIDKDENSKDIVMYDPETDTYTVLKSATPLTGARAVSIDGNVYIAGGCYGDNASAKIYKVDKSSNSVSEYASLTEGRCNFGIADISTEKNGVVTPAILVLGGSTDENGENPVLSNFAEVIIGGKSTVIELTDRNNTDSAELTINGLISPATVSVDIKNFQNSETVVAVTGGYFKYFESNSELITSPYFYTISNVDGKWIYDISAMPYQCARPAVGKIGSIANSGIGHFAINCGTRDIEVDSKATDNQVIFTAKIKKVIGQENDYYEVAVQSTLMEEHRDPENGVIINGPVAVDKLGQAFMFGTEYVYQVGSYSIPAK